MGRVALFALSGARRAGRARGARVRRSSAGSTARRRRAWSRRVHVGDRFAVLKFGAPEVGDVVVLHPPRGAENGPESCGGGNPPAGAMCARPGGGRAEVQFIKRVVAEGGDEISMRGGKIIRNGKRRDHRGPAGVRGRRLRVPEDDHGARRATSSCSATTAAPPTTRASGARPGGLGDRPLLVRVV